MHAAAAAAGGAGGGGGGEVLQARLEEQEKTLSLSLERNSGGI